MIGFMLAIAAGIFWFLLAGMSMGAIPDPGIFTAFTGTASTYLGYGLILLGLLCFVVAIIKLRYINREANSTVTWTDKRGRTYSRQENSPKRSKETSADRQAAYARSIGGRIDLASRVGRNSIQGQRRRAEMRRIRRG